MWHVTIYIKLIIKCLRYDFSSVANQYARYNKRVVETYMNLFAKEIFNITNFLFKVQRFLGQWSSLILSFGFNFLFGENV